MAGNQSTTNSDRPLGVLLLSGARHQSAFADVLSRQPGIRLVAVADEPDIPDWVRDENRALAEHWGLPYTEDVDAALARPDVDIVSLCSLYSRHGPLTVRALNAGKHIFLDKQPMAMSADEAREVQAAVRAAEANGQKLTYANHAVNPTVQGAKRAIERGEIGEPKAVFVSAIVTYGPGEDDTTDPNDKWVRGLDPKWWSGGEVIHHGGYALGVARYLMGSEITSVYAVMAGHFNRIHREKGSEDLATLSLGFANGGVGTLVIARTPNPAHPSYADEFVNVVGTHGAVTADWEKPSFLLCDGEAGLGRREMYGRADTVTIVILDFVRAVQSGGRPAQGGADGVAESMALVAAYQSAREGRVIELSELN
ncbi:MAG: myo-inositol 2-dehydrogenase / D-chiro-inositol 1-dehydrogenase [Thermomicrobiales bacterium]|jgi:predicted dehydrogenase|nr:myo-inositol 2-dehydrogenase / D-chiro-inositol 1-dehydrogenase [Thermomicrobiales bacterium]